MATQLKKNTIAVMKALCVSLTATPTHQSAWSDLAEVSSSKIDGRFGLIRLSNHCVFFSTVIKIRLTQNKPDRDFSKSR